MHVVIIDVTVNSERSFFFLKHTSSLVLYYTTTTEYLPKSLFIVESQLTNDGIFWDRSTEETTQV